MSVDVVKVLTPAMLAFFVGIALTPFITHYLYKYKMWKKKPGKQAGLGGGGTPIFNKLHKAKDTGTPRMGGIVVWASVLVTILLVWIASKIFVHGITAKLDFLSRAQTWLPLFTLVSGALVGLLDDFMVVRGSRDYLAGGLSLTKRLLVVFFIGIIGAWWFYTKLEVSEIMVPFWGDLSIGLLFIPFFILVMLAVYAGGVIDGIDGLSGGVFAMIFSAYGIIAFAQNQIDLAAFSFAIVGALLAFLWFNIPPARFYMSETGIMGLTLTLTVIAFLTKQVLLLPIIAFPLFVTVLSNIIQVTSKKLRGGKKVFLVAPIHHHFEAIGWPNYKVTMRYWIISAIFATLGIILALTGNIVV